jgi:hypothetical protein
MRSIRYLIGWDANMVASASGLLLGSLLIPRDREVGDLLTPASGATMVAPTSSRRL